MTKKANDWLLALALTLPMVVFFVSYSINHDAQLSPTGFIQYDNVSYIAYAKQYLDADHAGLMYSNPFNESNNYTPIYFQPQISLLAILMSLGISTQWLLIIFTLLCTFLCFRLLILIYDHLIPYEKYRLTSIIILAWGGGLLAFSGFILKLFNPSIESIFHLDPAAGWWGLNLGRSLFFSCEAYYHLLFFAVITSILKQKWLLAAICSFILSISHPFTGIEILSIVATWCLVERVIMKETVIPVWFQVIMVLLISFHCFYYLYYLNQFPEHKAVSDQYELNWRLRYFNMIPAYCLVGLLAAASLLIKPVREKLKSLPANRLLIIWFIVAFLLANHELFIKPMQPIHFTRGYIWTSLLLIGLPALHIFFERISQPVRKWVISLCVLIFLSDNAAWIFSHVNYKATEVSTSYISNEEKQVFEAINKNCDNNTLLISNESDVSYLSTVYSKVYPWYSHPFTTPFAQEKLQVMEQFILTGNLPHQWEKRSLIFVFKKTSDDKMRRSYQLPIPTSLILDTRNYRVLKSGK